MTRPNIKFCIALSLITLFIYGCGNNNNKTETTNKPAENPVKEIVKTDSEELKKEKKKTQEIKVTFVELGSVGCIPCKMMQPIMKEIEEEYGDQVKVIFYDVWTEEGKPYAQKYRIRLIPTQVFLDKDGNEYYRHEGYFPKDELVKVLRMKGVE